MGEIKFRAWITDYALMTDVSFLNTVYKEIIVMIDENDYEFNSGEYELMQYTGLKDKNGAEIYEGDIIECLCEGNGFVTKRHGTFGIETIFGFYPFIELFGELEVIGNMYEHPHLI